MRLILLLLLMLYNFALTGQEIECDGSFYLVVYTESEGKSRLYQVTDDGTSFDYKEIELSESRRLTGLNYNLDDKLLYALDVNTLEVIKIDGKGTISSLGVPANIDHTLEYSSGTFSPQSGGMLFSGFDPTLQKDTKMYGLNLERFYAGDLGVTGAFPVKITDLATDPLTGVVYGFNSLRSTLMQTSLSGGTTSYQYDAVQSSDIDALFFSPAGQLYGYSPSSGLYAIDKADGNMISLGKEVEGTHADGCSCPYTFEFTKEITPKEIIPCEEFTVEYKFKNQMAIGQVVEELRDTFPEGFEITNVQTDLISTFSTVLDTEKNILAIDLFIYLVGDNSIKVTVKAPENFSGEFGSRATQSEFASAFGTVLRSDDPETEILSDPTTAKVISAEQIDFADNISYSCDGKTATISSPIQADSYQWSTGETASSIQVSDVGIYNLSVSNECITYVDSIKITSFPGAKVLDIGDDLELVLGDSKSFLIDEQFSNLRSVEWLLDGALIDCDNCREVSIKPNADATLTVNIVDAQGCTYSDELNVTLRFKRDVYLANVFTPNGDGVNDFFTVQTASLAEIKSMKVYNRWGSLVFEKSNFPTNSEQEGWDGTLNGSVINNSVFVYMVEIVYPNGFEEKLSGEVLMISN